MSTKFPDKLDKNEDRNSQEFSMAVQLEKMRDNVQTVNRTLETMRVELMTMTMEAIVSETKLKLEQELLLVSQKIEAFGNEAEQLKIDHLPSVDKIPINVKL